jgi:hypothetical protein
MKLAQSGIGSKVIVIDATWFTTNFDNCAVLGVSFIVRYARFKLKS